MDHQKEVRSAALPQKINKGKDNRHRGDRQSLVILTQLRSLILALLIHYIKVAKTNHGCHTVQT